MTGLNMQMFGGGGPGGPMGGAGSPGAPPGMDAEMAEA